MYNAYGQPAALDDIAKLLNTSTQTDTLIFRLNDVRNGSEIYYCYQYNKTNQLVDYAAYANKDSMTIHKQFQYDTKHNLVQEFIMDEKSINYYRYTNAYLFGRLKRTEIINHHVIIRYNYGVLGRLQQITIETGNDSIEYLFGYPKQFEYDFEYDMQKDFNYSAGKLSQITSSIKHPKFEEINIVKYQYNTEGDLKSEIEMEGEYILHSTIYKYDTMQRLTEIKQDALTYSIHYVSEENLLPDFIVVYSANQLVYEIILANKKN